MRDNRNVVVTTFEHFNISTFQHFSLPAWQLFHFLGSFERPRHCEVVVKVEFSFQALAFVAFVAQAVQMKWNKVYTYIHTYIYTYIHYKCRHDRSSICRSLNSISLYHNASQQIIPQARGNRPALMKPTSQKVPTAALLTAHTDQGMFCRSSISKLILQSSLVLYEMKMKWIHLYFTALKGVV